MSEVTDPQERWNIDYLLQNIPIDAPAQFRFHRGWKHEIDATQGTITWYSVELIEHDSGTMLWGLLDSNQRRLYLDVGSMMVLVNRCIARQLDAFNAGHHWRYKGL